MRRRDGNDMQTSQDNRLTPQLLRSLDSLRAALRRRLAAEGLSWLVVAGVAGVLATMGLDYLLNMERPVRAGMMLAALAGLGYVAWRWLIAPLAAPMPLADLAMLVERRYRTLGDRLASAIDFTRGAADLSASPAMIAHVVRQANESAAGMDFQAVVDRRGLRRVGSLALSAALLLGGLCVWQGGLMHLWFQRNIVLADTPWPQDTYLRIAGGPDYRVLRGEDLEIVVEAEAGSVAPPQITVHSRFASLAGTTEETVAADPAHPGRFIHTFRGVSEEFTFHVTGGDDRRDAQRPHRVSLIDPPSLSALEFAVEYPAYMNRPPAVFDGARGVLTAPVGSLVTVRGACTKNLRAVALSLDGRPVGEAAVSAGADGSPRGVLGRFHLTGENRSATRTLRIALTDSEGYANARDRGCVIQIQPDLAPTIEARKRGVAATITPNAFIPLALSGRDEHGIAAVRMAVRKGGPEAKVIPVKVETLPQPVREYTGNYVLDLAAQEQSRELASLNLQPNEVISIWAEAMDALPAETGGPNVGKSGSMELRIVRPEELMAELVRRQKEIRQEFVQAIALQEGARAKTLEAQALLQVAQVSPEIVRQLGASGSAQSSVASELAKVAEGLAAIHEELLCNRLGNVEDNVQLRDGVIAPLRALQKPAGELVTALGQVAAATDPQMMRQQAGEIAAQQLQLRRQMEEILLRMQKLESRQELANQLQVIIQWSQQLLDQVQKQREDDLGDIFKKEDGE